MSLGLILMLCVEIFLEPPLFFYPSRGTGRSKGLLIGNRECNDVTQACTTLLTFLGFNSLHYSNARHYQTQGLVASLEETYIFVSGQPYLVGQVNL